MGISNKIFCTAPFTTLRIESYSATSPGQYSNLGVVFKPGCVYDPGAPIGSLQEYLHGGEMEEHRHNLCHGSIPKPNCHKCSEVEKQDLQSIRMALLKKPWASDQKKIRLLDIFFSNVCNLGCLMCSPDSSSYLSNERFQAGLLSHPIKVKNNIDLALDTIDQLPDLESVSFIGGEFFMMKDNSRIIEKIIQRGLACTIHTNAMIMNAQLLDMLERIDDLEIRMSIDGVHDVFEFIRYPAVWKEFENNAELLANTFPRAEKFFSIVIQPLNLQNIHEVYAWANRRIIQTHHQIIETPHNLSWSILRDEEKQLLSQILTCNADKTAGLTKQQRCHMKDIAQSLSGFKHVPDHRLQCIHLLSRLMVHRGVSLDKIKTVLGSLTTLADEIVAEMHKIS